MGQSRDWNLLGVRWASTRIESRIPHVVNEYSARSILMKVEKVNNATMNRVRERNAFL